MTPDAAFIPFVPRPVTTQVPERSRTWMAFAIAVVVAAPLYNGMLAFLFARGFPITTSIVALTEIVILGGAVLLIATTKLTQADFVPIVVGYGGVLIGVALSLANDRVFADGMRIFIIIGTFAILGARVTLRQVDRAFLILTAVVLVFLALELASTPLYVWLFEPASYYEATRGVVKFSLDKSGLFRNSLGFTGRFSLNPFSSYRTSSIFIEQVSLANFAGILVIYLLTRWSVLGRASRLFHAMALVVILMTNSTRTTIGLAALGLAGYWIYPRLPRWGTLFVAPAIIGTGIALLAWFGPSTGDDLSGRIGITMQALANLDWQSYLGLAVDRVYLYGDSGYPYMIVATSIFGALMFWLFASLHPPRSDAAQRRCAWATAIYLFANLMIGGSAIFSIKVAAPLWFLIGALRASNATPPRAPRGPAAVRA